MLVLEFIVCVAWTVLFCLPRRAGFFTPLRIKEDAENY